MNDEIAPKKKAIDAHDCIAILGLALLIGGIFWIYRPAAPIALGAILIVYAWVSARPQGIT